MDKIPTFIKKSLKWLGVLLVGIILYFVVMLVIAYIPLNSNTKPCNEECIDVYLLSNGVHTDIVLPVVHELKDWNSTIDSRKTKAGNTGFQYISIGWGDKGFYLNTATWGELTFKTAFEALFYMSESAMHITFYNTMTESERCRKIAISRESYNEILQYIDSSFKRDTRGACIYIENAHYNNNDIFFEAKGKYSLFYTCNTWTNNCLKAGRQKACLWTLLDKGIFYQYR